MKRLQQALILTLALLTASCATQERITVTSDRDMSAPYDSYKTYTWAKHVNTASSLAYALNDMKLKSMVRDAIAHELLSRKIEMTSQKPDLLVNFRVFKEPVTVETAEGYFRDADYWGVDEVTNNRLGIVPFATTIYDDDDRKYYLDEGTLMVQLVDADKGVVVWQGYASGLMNSNVFDRDPAQIAKAVRLIFEKLDNALNEV